MPAAEFTAGAVMDGAAALLNDAAKSVYTYSVQIPYLKIALRELREMMELSNVPVTNKTAEILAIPASTGVIEISFVTTPSLPSDLIEIQQIWERATGVNPYVPMVKKEFLPAYLTDGYQPSSNYLIWAWNGNKLQLPPCNEINDLKLNYVYEITQIVDQNSTIAVPNGESFLTFRTAALCAQFVMENKERADDLNADAGIAVDRMEGIESKAKQATFTRKRPFRASFKKRGNW